MTPPKHTNPTREERRAKAPYNFVPLPEKVVLAKEPPEMDRYHPDLYSGWLDCELTNDAPLYIRAGWTEAEARKRAEKEKEEGLPPDFFFLDPDTREPVIPGSSLRGMFRTLIEIITYSKVQPVANQPKVFFRAVAAPKDDPLTKPYQEVTGRFGSKVHAGYVVRRNGRWYVKPAPRPRDLGLLGTEAYLKVKDRDIEDGAIPNFIRFSEKDYRPQYHEVSFDVKIRHGKRGKYVAISRIGPRDKGYPYHGVLVCSGNMAETGSSPRQHGRKGGKGKSRRTHYALVLDPLPHASPLPIQEQAVKDYIDGLTEFQKKPPFDERLGCLIEGRPIFYVKEGNEVVAFGHTPYFRVPAWLKGSSPKRAATPRDFVPEQDDERGGYDIAEALFGYVEQGKTGKRPVARAGRLFFSDAKCVKPCEPTQPIVPHILASPKPTTFQHYLVQDKRRGHNPDVKPKLAHYGTSPDETAIRGHKLYWHKGKIGIEAIKEDERKAGAQEELIKKVKSGEDTQHTYIKPLESGARFHFRIDFENLRAEELGALLWLLKIAADDHYRLKLGMGKPLGMGAVKITSTLHLIDREARYRHLFQGNAWATGEITDATKVEKVWTQSIEAFEQYVFQRVKPADRTQKPSHIQELDRIRELLALLTWPEPNQELTRYMEIEYQDPLFQKMGAKAKKVNEFKERPVLPTPRGIQAIDEKKVYIASLGREVPPETRFAGTIREIKLNSEGTYQLTLDVLWIAEAGASPRKPQKPLQITGEVQRAVLKQVVRERKEEEYLATLREKLKKPSRRVVLWVVPHNHGIRFSRIDIGDAIRKQWANERSPHSPPVAHASPAPSHRASAPSATTAPRKPNVSVAPCTATKLKRPQSEDEIERGDCLEGELVGLDSKQATISLGVSQGTIQAQEIVKAFQKPPKLQGLKLKDLKDHEICRMIVKGHYRLIVRVQGRKKGKKNKSPWRLQFIRWVNAEDREKRG